jgi:PIN domain nuclease of toxin-antitoxin system
MGSSEEMRLLLDTHIWIWNVAAPDKLKKSVAKAIDDEKNELWLSPISIWELSMLVEKQRIELDDDVDAWVSRSLAQTTFREAPLTNEVALEIPKIRFSHRDPADHFIAASAKVFDLTLVTADPRLLALKDQGLAVLSNR